LHAAAFGTGGDSQGNTLSQSFATVPGQTYNVDFDAGIFGMKTGLMQLRVQAIGNSSVLDQTVTPPYAGTYVPKLVRFQHYHNQFVADSNMTTLRFTDLGLGNTNADTILDTVSVVGPVPPSMSVVNGDFEAGAVDWVATGAAGISSGVFPHTGDFYGYRGNASNTAGSLTNDIVIPQGSTSVKLSFWLNITSGQAATAQPPDTLTVGIFVPTGLGGLVELTLATFTQADRGSNQAGNPYYVQKTIDLGDYLTFTLATKLVFRFSSSNSTPSPTIFRIDDVRLEALLSP
jgi:hypothetical protein